MGDKTSVSTLQEFCSKRKLPQPSYTYITAEDGGFVCEAEILDISEHGIGRSKRDAKHVASSNVIKKLRYEYPDIDNKPQDDELPATDMIVKLRDYCVKNDHPLPVMEIIQQGGSPDAPEFTALCAVATIRRYGTSSKKKDARQKAAMGMLTAIMKSESDKMDVARPSNLQKIDIQHEVARYQKFSTYRELTESKSNDSHGTLLSDRHNYFNNFYEPLKTEALTILNTPYESNEAQVLDVLSALKIYPVISEMANINSPEPMLFVDLKCEFDAVFAGSKDYVYKDMLCYFRAMLV